jgi:hypothetical protein
MDIFTFLVFFFLTFEGGGERGFIYFLIHFLFRGWAEGSGGGINGVHEISIPKRVHHPLEPEWEMRRTGCEDQRGALCTGYPLVIINTCSRYQAGRIIIN